MSINKKKQTKIKKKGINKSNIVFILVFILVLILIVFLSLNIEMKSDDNSVYSYSSSEFEYVTTIGLSEYEASFYYEGTSIIFFCSNEEEDCYSEMVALNSVASSNDLSIEYIDILELVDSEKEELSSSSDIFNNALYPNLVIIQDGEIVGSYDEYLNEEADIEEIFEEYGII